jgi:uracil-DNA glycosylase
MAISNHTIQKITPKLHESWLQYLYKEFDSQYFKELKDFLLLEKAAGAQIYPPGPLIFNAFNHTPFDKVKVVILGQDPYHGPGQANGLCFSVAPGIRQPPSLQNIFKELHSDLGIPVPASGDLTPWADQGVLLLNATLTVKRSSPGSHQKRGWEMFTDSVIRKLSDERTGLVFLLWGRYAQEKANLIDGGKHFVLKAPHPSPFSAASGFFGCRHFSKTNEILTNLGESVIDWRIGT